MFLVNKHVYAICNSNAHNLNYVLCALLHNNCIQRFRTSWRHVIEVISIHILYCVLLCSICVIQKHFSFIIFRFFFCFNGVSALDRMSRGLPILFWCFDYSIMNQSCIFWFIVSLQLWWDGYSGIDQLNLKNLKHEVNFGRTSIVVGAVHLCTAMHSIALVISFSLTIRFSLVYWMFVRVYFSTVFTIISPEA